MQDAPKEVWSIPYVSVAFFPSLKQNFIAYRSSKVSSCPDCIFEIPHLWQSGFSKVYSNCCCSCSFEAEIIKIGQSSHKMYSNNIVNFQEFSTILNACIKKSLKTYWMHHINNSLKKYKSIWESIHFKIFTFFFLWTYDEKIVKIYVCVCVCVYNMGASVNEEASCKHLNTLHCQWVRPFQEHML